MWTDWLTSASSAMGTTVTEAGIILSLVFTIVIVLVCVLGSSSKSQVITVPLGATLGVVLFTFMGWFPLWTGSVLALILAIFLGKTISGW